MPQVTYYSTADGTEPVSDYLDSLERNGEGVALGTFEHAVRLLAEFGVATGMPHVRMIHRKPRVWEIRFGDHRVGFVQEDDTIVLLRGWRKRSQKLDRRELERTLRLLE